MKRSASATRSSRRSSRRQMIRSLRAATPSRSRAARSSSMDVSSTGPPSTCSSASAARIRPAEAGKRLAHPLEAVAVVDEEARSERAELLGDRDLEVDEHVVVGPTATGDVEHMAQALALVHGDHREGAAGAGDGIERAGGHGASLSVVFALDSVDGSGGGSARTRARGVGGHGTGIRDERDYPAGGLRRARRPAARPRWRPARRGAHARHGPDRAAAAEPRPHRCGRASR